MACAKHIVRHAKAARSKTWQRAKRAAFIVGASLLARHVVKRHIASKGEPPRWAKAMQRAEDRLAAHHIRIR